LLFFAVAVSLTNCIHKREDFETAKTAIVQQLRSPETARFCTVDEGEVFWQEWSARRQAVGRQSKLGRLSYPNCKA